MTSGFLGNQAGFVGLVLLMFCGDYSWAVRRLALAFAAVVMLSPIIQPRYILWFVPFLAATNRASRPTARTKTPPCAERPSGIRTRTPVSAGRLQ